MDDYNHHSTRSTTESFLRGTIPPIYVVYLILLSVQNHLKKFIMLMVFVIIRFMMHVYIVD